MNDSSAMGDDAAIGSKTGTADGPSSVGASSYSSGYELHTETDGVGTGDEGSPTTTIGAGDTERAGDAEASGAGASVSVCSPSTTGGHVVTTSSTYKQQVISNSASNAFIQAFPRHPPP